jgi:hypothetical protein
MLPIVLLALLADTPSPSPSPRPKPCSAPEHRQLDFWVGDWDVLLPNGKVAGRNTITSEYGGCVIQEHWTGAGGVAGSSFNTYEPATRKWHQVWVDNTGTLLQLRGGRDGEAMVLEGDVPTAEGGVDRHSLRLQPMPDGKVRQLWRSTSDGGKTWTIVFDGTYVRRK